MTSSSLVASKTPWPARIEGPTAKALRKEIGRAFRAGELAAVGPLELVSPGVWAVDVLRLKERRTAPAWRRPALLAGGAVAVLAGFAALGWWLAGVTMAATDALSLPLILGGAGVLLGLRALLRAGGSHRRGCETTITVHHRCR